MDPKIKKKKPAEVQSHLTLFKDKIVSEKNKQVPGFDNSGEISEEQQKPKKRVRNKKKPQPQAKMSPEMHGYNDIE